MPKKKVHPKWYSNAKVYCDGQLILKIGATRSRLDVEVWSKIHPAYTGSNKVLDTEGRIEDFIRKYGWDGKIEFTYANNTTTN